MFKVVDSRSDRAAPFRVFVRFLAALYLCLAAGLFLAALVGLSLVQNARVKQSLILFPLEQFPCQLFWCFFAYRVVSGWAFAAYISGSIHSNTIQCVYVDFRLEVVWSNVGE